MRTMRMILWLIILSGLLTACASQPTPQAIFEDAIVPTRDVPQTSNTPALTTGIGTVFPAVVGGEIQIGESISGMLADSQYAVLYTVEGQIGQTVDITLNARDNILDTFLILLAPDGRELARNDDRSDNRRDAALNRVELPVEGNYTIVATRWRQRYGDTNGEFMLEVRESNVDTPTPLTRRTSYGVTQRGRLDEEVGSQAYTFSGEAGELIDITIFATDNGNLDPALILTDSYGNELAANEDSNPVTTLDSAIYDFRLPYSGYYTVVASRFEGTAGEYELTVEQDGEDTADVQYAYLDANQSVSLLSENKGLRSYGFFIGDIFVWDATTETEIPSQVILTYYLPPNLDFNLASLDLQVCDRVGLGFDAIEAISIYGTDLDERINASTPIEPGDDDPFIGELTNCDLLDVTDYLTEQIDSGAERVQFRLLPQSTQLSSNEEDAIVIIDPKLIFEGE